MTSKAKVLKTIGFVLLTISCLSFISILVIPWLGFSTVKIAGITTALVIVGEVLFYLSLFILGRSFYDKIKNKLKFWKGKPKSAEPPTHHGESG